MQRYRRYTEVDEHENVDKSISEDGNGWKHNNGNN